MVRSRDKGIRGEKLWRNELREQGWMARRGQQFSGSPDSPDVVCEELGCFHFEVKNVERFNAYEAMEQATRDAGERQIPVVAHKRNRHPWLVVMTAEAFFRLVRNADLEELSR